MSGFDRDNPFILPRERWWWLGLSLLLLLAAWLYLRGYNVSLPYIEHHDEAQNLLEAQHIIDFGHARGVFRESYPPGLRAIVYPFLKHIKPADAHHGTMLPPLRLITIGAWMLAVVFVALLGAMIAHPLTGLMAAAIWIVNPWVVNRAHFVLPDGYLTLFTLLAIWLALVGALHRRRSFSTSATYSIMVAIAFKTQAIFVAPFIVFLPLIKLWTPRGTPHNVRRDALQQTFWNCLRFAIFLFWLLVLYPTLDAPRDIHLFPVLELRLTIPSPQTLWDGLSLLLRTFQPLGNWLAVALAGALLWRYRERVNGVALLTVALSALAWLVGTLLLPTRGFHLRQYFGMGAMLAILYACGLTGLLFAGQEALALLKRPRIPQRARTMLAGSALLILLALMLLPAYQESDALAHNFTLPDRRNDLMRYMDTSLQPGNYITDRNSPNHKTMNRAWGGYTGLHDFPLAQEEWNLLKKPLEVWREKGAVYAIVPYEPLLKDPNSYFPDETVLLKSYPPDNNFRGPSMVVLSLYPMQHELDWRLGSISFKGYDSNGAEFAPGDTVIFRFYWRAQTATATAHHVYNHLVNEAGEIAAQVDGIPLWDGRRDTSTWDDPDEILLGRNYLLHLPMDLPAGRYKLISGFYDPGTGARLTAVDGGDHARISDILVSAIG